MAGAEEIERPAAVAEMLDENAVGERMVGSGGAPSDPAVPVTRPRHTARGRKPRRPPRREVAAPAASRLRVEDLDQQCHPAAAALAEFRPERHGGSHRRAGPAEQRLRLGDGLPFQCRRRRWCRESRHRATTMPRAGFARRRALRLSTTVTMAQRAMRCRGLRRYVPRPHVMPACQRVDRPHDRFRRRRCVERRHGARLEAGDGVGDGARTPRCASISGGSPTALER